MKKTSKLFKLAMVIAAGGITVAVLEVFDLHPQLNAGNFSWFWVGVRKADLTSSGSMLIGLTNGNTLIYQEYNFALFKIVRTEEVDSPKMAETKPHFAKIAKQ